MDMNNNMPLISVLMPVYNGEKYISEAIDSILNQTIKEIELLIIDGGSNDSTVNIITKYAEQDKRIRPVLYGRKNLIEQLNEGIARSRADFVARMDADDISMPNRFEKQIDQMKKTEADICGCHFFEIDDCNKFLKAQTVPLTHEGFLIFLAISVPFAHGSIMLRKSFLQKNNLRYGGNDFKYSEDYSLWLRFFEHNAKFTNVNDFLFKLRKHTQSTNYERAAKVSSDRKDLSSMFRKKYKKEILGAMNILADQSLSVDELKMLRINALQLLLFNFELSALQPLKRTMSPTFIGDFFRMINVNL